MDNLDHQPPLHETRPAGASHRRWVIGLAMAAGVVLGVGAVWMGWLPSSAENPGITPALAIAPATPGLQRNADSVTVPAGSTYRQQIAVTEVERRSVDQTITLPAAVESDPARVFNVLPPLGGRVIELKVGLGATVAAGQPLVVIDSGDLAQASSDVEKARAQSALTHRALDRARSLTQTGGGAVKDLESAANDAAQADAELARAQARLKTITGTAAVTGIRTFTVSAPAAGIITTLAIAPGSYINDPTQSLMTVSNLGQIWVRPSVPEDDIGFVARGQRVDLTFLAYPHETFHGTVTFVDDVLDPDTRRVKARIPLDNPDGRFKPNMFANVTFHAPPQQLLLVPNGALLMNNDSTTVFVETAPWTFTRRVVQPGYDADGQTVINSGLSAGDRVVSRGGVLLND